MDIASGALEMVTSTAQKGTDAVETITSTVRDGAKSIKKLPRTIEKIPKTIDGALKESATTIANMPSNLQESVIQFFPMLEEKGPRNPKPGDELFDAAAEFKEDRSIEECFENQKRGRDGNWRPPRTQGDPAPYSDRSHVSRFDARTDFPLRPGWKWYDDTWTLDR